MKKKVVQILKMQIKKYSTEGKNYNFTIYKEGKTQDKIGHWC